MDPTIQAAIDQSVARAFRQVAESLEGQVVSPLSISFDQPLEIQPIDAEQAAAIAGCKPSTLREWRTTKGWIAGIHYLGDGRYNATALKHWVAHQDDPQSHLRWCDRFQRARQQARSGRSNRGMPAA